MPYDVITFGEAMLRLSPPNFLRLEQAQSLDVRVGGAELNTAVGLARLGRSSAWVSRLPANPLGRLVANRTREAGRWMAEFMQYTDVLITTEEDVEKVFGIKGTNYEEVARQLAERFPLKVVAITLRENPLVWRNSWTAIAYTGGKVLKTRSYEVEIVDRVGAGASFAAGLTHGLL